MTKPITITGRAPALIDKYTSFDPAEPTRTRADQFVFVDPYYVKEGKLDPGWTKDGYRLVGWADITVTLMPHEEMLQAAVESLREQKTAVLAQAQAEATRIEGEIQKLLAITFEAPSEEA